MHKLDILNSIKESTAIVDKHGVIIFTNKAWKDFALKNFSSPANSGEGINYLQVCEKGMRENEDDVFCQHAYNGISEVISGEKDYYELEYPCFTENEKLWFLLKVNPVDHLEDYFLISHTDITKRKNYEQSVQESKERLKSIVESSNNVFFRHNINHEITYISPQIEGLLGFKPEEAKINWTQLLSDNQSNQLGFNLTEKAILTGKTQPAYELELRHKSGRRVVVEVRESPVLSEGKTIAIVGALVDITDRKEYEEKLEKTNNDLIESNEKLNKTNNLLKKANQELDNFVYRVSHDLRAPISSALGLAKITKESDSLEETKGYADLQIQSLQRLDQFIKDILNYSRNTRLDLTHEVIDFNEIVEEAIQESHFRLENTNIQIIKQISNHPGFRSDQLRLKIILKT